MLRAGVIGLGVGAYHAATYEAHPDCALAAVCDLSEEKLAAFQEQYPHVRTSRDAGEVLSDPDIDLVSIATYDSDHAEQVLAALENGKHVFVEKPMCLHRDEARRIRRALDARPELHISSNLLLRRCPRFQALRARVACGDLGDLYYVEGDYLYGRPEKLTAGWRGELEYYSLVHGGAVHVIDLLRWLTGAEIVEVKAYANKIATRDTAFRFNDLVAAIVTFDSGIIGKITVHGACVRPHFHALALYGTKATFINEPEAGRLTHSREQGADAELFEEPYPGYQKGDLVTEFIDALVDERPHEVNAREVFRTMSVCFAIERAAQETDAVRVNYI